jgi:hypothetical protein
MTVYIISVWNLLSSIITRDDSSGLSRAPSKGNVPIEKKKYHFFTFNDIYSNSKWKVSKEWKEFDIWLGKEWQEVTVA